MLNQRYRDDLSHSAPSQQKKKKKRCSQQNRSLSNFLTLYAHQV